MNRKQRIIISVTGIFIVLLVLVGLTYAYFLTRIQGNTNTKSISVTTADLKLTYGDGNGDITAEKIQPGTTIDTKTFTVKNEGNATVNNYAVYLEELVNTLSRTSDMVYTLTCTSSVSGKTCNGVNETSFPTQNGMLVTNNIDVNETQSYELKVVYKEMNIDQSEDMNKTISAKVQIYNLADIVDITGTVANASDGDYVEMQSNPKTSQIRDNKYFIPAVEPGVHTLYVKDSKGTVKGSKQITINKGSTTSVNGDTITVTSDSQTISLNITNISSTLTINIGDVKDYMPFEEGTLAYNILNNAKNGTLDGKSIFTANLSAVGMVNNITTATDKILSTAEDDIGTTYYFRGNPIDNYVNFSGMCWRIVRIQGDESIKMILASEKTCSTTNLTDNSGYATDGATGTQGTIIGANYGYKIVNSYYINDYINSASSTNNARTKLNAWLERKITSESDKALLKNETWCIGDQTNGYDSTGKVIGKVDDLINSGTSFKFTAGNKYSITKTPSYKCETTGVDGEIDINKVGMLTFDEIVYAGGGVSAFKLKFYLNNNATTNYWWTLSPSYFDSIDTYVSTDFVLDDGGIRDGSYLGNTFPIRPAVSLKSGIQISSGNGTISNPYVIQ